MLQVVNKLKSATWTIAANGFASLIKMLVFIISVPLLMNYLGTEQYGLIATITSMCIWLNTITDGGLGLSIKNEIIKENALNGLSQKINQLISTGLFAMLFLTILVGIVGSLCSFYINWQKILNIGITIKNTQLILFILAILWLILLYIPLSFPRVIYASLQKEYLFAPWSILGSLLGLILTWYFIKKNLGLAWVGSAIQLGSVMGAMLALISFQMKMKPLNISLKNINLKLLRVLTKPGMDFLILQITSVIIFQTDVFIVNLFLGQEAAANYSLHFQIFVYFQMLITLLTNPFWSILGHAYHAGEINWLKKLTSVLIIIIGILCLIFCVFINYAGHSIMSLWSHHHLQWSPSLGLVLSSYSFVSVMTCFLAMILNSLGVSKEPKNIIVLQAVLNLVLSIYLVKTLGVLGVALGSLISSLITVAWYTPFKLFKVLFRAEIKLISRPC